MQREDSPELTAGVAADYDELLRVLTRRLGDAERAGEVVQETYVRLATRRTAPSEVGNPRAYIFRVAGNLATDWLRRDGRSGRRTAPESAAAEVPDPRASPEAALLARQRLALLDAALRELPAKPRQALLMSRVEGRSFADIAAELGVSESMVAKYVAQALKACRARLRQAEDDGE